MLNHAVECINFQSKKQLIYCYDDCLPLDQFRSTCNVEGTECKFVSVAGEVEVAVFVDTLQFAPVRVVSELFLDERVSFAELCEAVKNGLETKFVGSSQVLVNHHSHNLADILIHQHYLLCPLTSSNLLPRHFHHFFFYHFSVFPDYQLSVWKSSLKFSRHHPSWAASTCKVSFLNVRDVQHKVVFPCVEAALQGCLECLECLVTVHMYYLHCLDHLLLMLLM